MSFGYDNIRIISCRPTSLINGGENRFQTSLYLQRNTNFPSFQLIETQVDVQKSILDVCLDFEFIVMNEAITQLEKQPKLKLKFLDFCHFCAYTARRPPADLHYTR